MSPVLRWWNDFWFKPQSPTPMALFRIFIGLLAFQEVTVHYSYDWSLYYGDHGFFSIDTLSRHWWQSDPVFDAMLLLPPGDEWKMGFFAFHTLICLCVIFGLWTRWTTIFFFFGLMSIDRHFPFNLNGGDAFMRLSAVILPFSRCGDAFSIDNLIKVLKEDWRKTGLAPPRSSPWAQRMVQVELALAYCDTWIWKMSGRTWQDGDAVYYATRMEEFYKFPVPFMFDNKPGIVLLTWGTLFVEGILWSFIWFREFRYWVLLFGIGLHLGIDYCINLPIFEWMFMAAMITFVYPEDLTRVWDWVKAQIKQRYGEPHVVAYDGNCIFCVRVAGLLAKMDIFGRFNLVDFRQSVPVGADPDRLEKEMMLQAGTGWLGGFDAFRYIAGRLPLLWPLVPVLWLPGVSAIGRAIYGQVAARRYLILGGHCSSGTCQIDHGPKAVTELGTSGGAEGNGGKGGNGYASEEKNGHSEASAEAIEESRHE